MAARLESLAPRIVGLMLLFYLSIQAYFYLVVPGLVPDEIVFVGRIATRVQGNLLVQQNDLGYGALYWWLYRIASCPAAYAAWSMRLLSLALSFSVLVAVATARGTAVSRLLGVLLYLTFPAAWWYGKVIGPELLCTACVTWGLWCGLRERWCLAALLVGLGTGVKPNGAAAGVALSALWLGWVVRAMWGHLLFEGGQLIRLPDRNRALLFTTTGMALAGILGLVLANPFMLLEPEAYFQSFADNHAGARPFAGALFAIVGYEWQWDIVFSGGLIRWALMPVPAGLFIVAIVLGCPFAVTLSAFGGTCALWGLFVASRAFLGWYWLPIVPLLALSAASLKPERRVPRLLLIAAIVLNFIWQVPFVLDGMWVRWKLGEVVAATPAVNQCLKDKVQGRSFPVLLNCADAWIHFDLPTAGKSRSLKLLDVVNAMKTPKGIEELLAVQGSALLLIGDRVQHHQDFPIIELGQFSYEGHCGPIAVYSRSTPSP